MDNRRQSCCFLPVGHPRAERPDQRLCLWTLQAPQISCYALRTCPEILCPPQIFLACRAPVCGQTSSNSRSLFTVFSQFADWSNRTMDDSRRHALKMWRKPGQIHSKCNSKILRLLIVRLRCRNIVTPHCGRVRLVGKYDAGPAGSQRTCRRHPVSADSNKLTLLAARPTITIT